MLVLMSMSWRVASICVCSERLLDRRDHHIGGQRGVRRDHLEAHRLLLRLQRLHGPAVQAENIGHIGNADLRGEQIEQEGVGVGRRRDLSRLPLAAGREACRRHWDSKRPVAPGHFPSPPTAPPAPP